MEHYTASEPLSGLTHRRHIKKYIDHIQYLLFCEELTRFDCTLEILWLFVFVCLSIKVWRNIYIQVDGLFSLSEASVKKGYCWVVRVHCVNRQRTLTFGSIVPSISFYKIPGHSPFGVYCAYKKASMPKVPDVIFSERRLWWKLGWLNLSLSNWEFMITIPCVFESFRNICDIHSLWCFAVYMSL